MKKAIFLLPALALVGFLAFCTKTDVQNELAPNPSSVTATDRSDTAAGGGGGGSAANCCFNVFSDNVHNIEFCGTRLNLTGCLDCGTGTGVRGVNVMVGDGSPLCIPANTTFYVRTASPGGSWINLVSQGGGSPGWVYIPAGDCRTFNVDANCNITVI
jgi:hypothetical protein